VNSLRPRSCVLYKCSEPKTGKMHTYQIFVDGRKVQTTRSGKAAFKDFEFYKLGDRQ
jgi:hypothetical protein